jgi:hypothetical protein
MDKNTGEIIEIDAKTLQKQLGQPVVSSADMLKAMEQRDLVPLKRLPLKNCKRCYGKGNLGRNVLTNMYVPCPCTQ